jgi:hypothetical protein
VNYANTSGFDSPAVVAVDLNHDNKLDVVIAHQIACYTAPCRVANTISVMLGNGNGTFQPTREVDVGRGMSKIAVGDFNRDGHNDLAIAGDSSRLYRLYGVGDGTFIQQPTLTMTVDTFAVDATDVDVADFNGDTIQDLVVAVALNGSRTAILIGNGDGTFRPPLILTEPNINVPHYQAVADYNGDGFQDLALSLGNGNQGLMETRNGNGDGTFQAPVYQVPPGRPSIGGFAIVAGNLDADTKPDLVLGIVGASPAVAVLINATGAAPPPPPVTPAAPALVGPAQDATLAQPIAFDWSDVSGATSYRIQIDDSSSFSTPIVVDQAVTVSQFTAPTLAVRQHWWRVRGVNSAGTAGAWSAVRRFTPQAATPPPGQTATVTVKATGRSGERITSSPAGINVTVGSTGSASFATGTPVKLSVASGRSAAWSGACSSGSNRTKSCTFTVSASATVTANVS